MPNDWTQVLASATIFTAAGTVLGAYITQKNAAKMAHRGRVEEAKAAAYVGLLEAYRKWAETRSATNMANHRGIQELDSLRDAEYLAFSEWTQWQAHVWLVGSADVVERAKALMDVAVKLPIGDTARALPFTPMIAAMRSDLNWDNDDIGRYLGL